MNAKPLEADAGESGGTWSISDLAAEFDVTPRAIRFYEDQGLIRRPGGDRRASIPPGTGRASS